jgi:hypothetical protein
LVCFCLSCNLLDYTKFCLFCYFFLFLLAMFLISFSLLYCTTLLFRILRSGKKPNAKFTGEQFRRALARRKASPCATFVRSL